MLLHSRTSEKLYAALLARDPAFDGHAFVGVATTGVFCRLACPALKPRFENTRFFETPAACLEAGFRPCLRCRPLHPAGEADLVVPHLLDCLERAPGRIWREGDLVAMGLDPSTVRRAFKRSVGMTFLDLARLRRAGLGVERIAEGSGVIEASGRAVPAARHCEERLRRGNPGVAHTASRAPGLPRRERSSQ